MPLEGTGEVVHDHPRVVRFQEGDEIERAVLDLGQERGNAREPLALEGLPEGVDELRMGVEDRYRRPRRRTGHVLSPFPAWRGRPQGRAVAARPAGAIQNVRGATERAA